MKKEELKKARETLIKYGLLLRVSDLDLYHGRVRKKGEEEWEVNPNFDNAGNNTGNHNINKRAALSTGDFSTASAFADARTIRAKREAYRRGEDISKFTPETYKIVSSDEDAVIVNGRFNYSHLSDEQKLEIEEALKITRAFGVSEFLPLPFEERNNYKVIVDVIISYKSNFKKILLKEEDITKICDKLKEKRPDISRDFVSEMVRALNTKIIIDASARGIRAVSSLFLDSGDEDSKFETADGYPLSEAYYSAWLANNHIVGLYRQVDSATLGFKTIDSVALFDLDKVNTQKVIGEKYQAIMGSFSKIAQLVNSFDLNKNMCKFLEQSTPEETMMKFRSRKNYDELFKAPAGVWEGFTVGEHTETVLRVFEDTYQDNVPKELLPFIKLALISHDIGKGVAYKEPNLNQRERNEKYAKIMCDELKIPSEVQEMLLFVIGKSQSYTTEYFVGRDIRAIDDLKKLTAKMLNGALKREPTEKEVEGLVDICKILQTCDSGAYTRYAITRKEGTNVYYYNGNDRFTKGFENPQGLSKRKLKMKEPGQE